jgi:hypothetical protein
MQVYFTTTISGSIARDPVTNAVTIVVNGIPAADMASLQHWLTDWIPVVPSASPPATAAKAK